MSIRTPPIAEKIVREQTVPDHRSARNIRAISAGVAFALVAALGSFYRGPSSSAHSAERQKEVLPIRIAAQPIKAVVPEEVPAEEVPAEEPYTPPDLTGSHPLVLKVAGAFETDDDLKAHFVYEKGRRANTIIFRRKGVDPELFPWAKIEVVVSADKKNDEGVAMSVFGGKGGGNKVEHYLRETDPPYSGLYYRLPIEELDGARRLLGTDVLDKERAQLRKLGYAIPTSEHTETVRFEGSSMIYTIRGYKPTEKKRRDMVITRDRDGKIHSHLEAEFDTYYRQ